MSDPSPLQVIEAAIRLRHVVRVGYRPLEGAAQTLIAEPYGIRRSHAGQVVLWIWDRQTAGWKELLLDRITDASDTGEAFEPRADWVSVAGA